MEDDAQGDPMGPVATRVLTVTADGEPRAAIAEAAALLRAGQLVAFPTETVYGLGADATNAAAVAGIFRAKERPYSDPLIVHLADVGQLAEVAKQVPNVARTLAERFWPGPLTLVLPRAPRIPSIVTAGGETVGARVPSHPVARELIRRAGVPVAAPSANRFMRTSPTTAAHVLADLEGRVACVLDAGPTSVGVESTVLDVTASPPRVLRPGGVTLEQLRAVVPEVEGPREAGGPVARAPGQMARHYAPNTPLMVFDGQGEAAITAIRRAAEEALARGERAGALLPDEEAGALSDLPVRVIRLGPSAQLDEVSRRLYAALREADTAGLTRLLAHTFGTEGLGLALADRLRRAAGGRLTPV